MIVLAVHGSEVEMHAYGTLPHLMKPSLITMPESDTACNILKLGTCRNTFVHTVTGTGLYKDSSKLTS